MGKTILALKLFWSLHARGDSFFGVCMPGEIHFFQLKIKRNLKTLYFSFVQVKNHFGHCRGLKLIKHLKILISNFLFGECWCKRKVYSTVLATQKIKGPCEFLKIKTLSRSNVSIFENRKKVVHHSTLLSLYGSLPLDHSGSTVTVSHEKPGFFSHEVLL